MKVISDRLPLSTRGDCHILDITEAVQARVDEHQLRLGTVCVFCPGSTGGLTTVEYEPGLLRDLPDFFERIAPQGAHYHHEDTWHDGNGHSHLQASTVGPSVTVPVAGGTPVLGTWQQIFHLECDVKLRQREIVVTVIGD